MTHVLLIRFPRYPTFSDNHHLRHLHLHNHNYSILTIPILISRCDLTLTYWSSSPPRSLTLILAVSTHMNLSLRVTGTKLWRTSLAASLFPFPELRFLHSACGITKDGKRVDFPQPSSPESETSESTKVEETPAASGFTSADLSDEKRLVDVSTSVEADEIAAVPEISI